MLSSVLAIVFGLRLSHKYFTVEHVNCNIFMLIIAFISEDRVNDVIQIRKEHPNKIPVSIID